MSEDDDEGRFLTAGQVEAYGRFVGTPVVEDLERFFFLDDVDRKLVRQRRGAANRLGFALQLTTVRYLGTFLDDPLDVPESVVEYLAGERILLIWIFDGSAAVRQDGSTASGRVSGPWRRRPGRTAGDGRVRQANKAGGH